MSERDYLSGSRRPGIVLLQPETDYTNFKKSEFFGLLREIRVIRVIRGDLLLPSKRHYLRRVVSCAATRSIAARLRSTSASVGAQEETPMRIARLPCQLVPPHMSS